MKPLKNASTILKKIRMIVFDFDGVFTDNAVYVNEKGEESVRCLRGDGYGIGLLRKKGMRLFVLSTEVNPVVGHRCKKLKLNFAQDCDDKQKYLKELIKKENLQLNQIAYVGNDLNDLSCLEIVGMPIVVQDAHPAVMKKDFFITANKGGQGAVREICDLFLLNYGNAQ